MNEYTVSNYWKEKLSQLNSVTKLFSFFITQTKCEDCFLFYLFASFFFQDPFSSNGIVSRLKMKQILFFIDFMPQCFARKNKDSMLNTFIYRPFWTWLSKVTVGIELSNKITIFTPSAYNVYCTLTFNSFFILLIISIRALYTYNILYSFCSYLFYPFSWTLCLLL